MFVCRHLDRAPIPDGDGGILIWVPGPTGLIDDSECDLKICRYGRSA